MEEPSTALPAVSVEFSNARRGSRAPSRLLDERRRRAADLELHPLRHRRDALVVEQEEHVVARGGELRAGRRGEGHAAGALGDGQRDVALVHVVRVGGRARRDQRGLGDVGIGRVDVERGADLRAGRRARDRRAGALEEVGRLVDLGAVAVGAAVDVVAGGDHAAVWEQQRGGVVGAGFGLLGAERPGAGGGVPEVDLALRGIGGPLVAVSDPDAAADGDHRPVGQQHRVVVAAPDLHRRRRAPAQPGVCLVEDLGRGDGDVGGGRGRSRRCRAAQSASPASSRPSRPASGPPCPRAGRGPCSG